MPWAILAPIVIVAGAAAIIALERWRPYDRGQPFLRDGFWVDLVTYALFQSYFLALLINLLIGWIDGWTGASRHGLVSGWPIAAQVAFFVIGHDLYIYWFHRLQHGNCWLPRHRPRMAGGAGDLRCGGERRDEAKPECNAHNQEAPQHGVARA
jgi:sterol desaturase/sphingolipid hydroxylase (fatty acid hydroxylase superfamily)